MTTIARVMNPITACLKKPETTKITNEDSDGEQAEIEEKIEHTEGEEPQPQGGMIWRMSSRLYNIGSGAVGMGVGSVKWAASTTYKPIAGLAGLAASTSTVIARVIPMPAPKPKKE